jgi:hypothetical protein
MLSFNAVFKEAANPKEKILIDIPFNLWELFNQKGVLSVDLTMNGIQIDDVQLLARGNGHYGLLFTKKLRSAININDGDTLSISMTPREKINQFKNTERENYTKISDVKLVMQPSSKTCGQACIAMIVNKEVADICKILHTSAGITIGKIIEALNYYGVRHAEKSIRLSKKNSKIPDIAILTVHLPEYEHWVVYYKGIYLDPEFGQINGEYNLGKITSYLEIFEC